jgi:ComF family protein
LPCAHYHEYAGNQLLRLFADVPQIQEVAAFLIYEKSGPVQAIIHNFKYRENHLLAEYLGQIASRSMHDDGLFEDVDLLIPVPLHPRKEFQRGYNQSFWIASGIASVYNYPINSRSLYRKIHTVSQTNKSLAERKLNMGNAFAVRNAHALAGKHVLLVDDVITTGSTTSACIQALTTIPDIRISIFALAVVPL